ncbi:ABC transporter substrate-binding protein [Gracilibacillus phocaeensis]|uniref:ABC transporter substrate-binding protein n=1 Tax=Gracilibacillus phocaeensis TaxID=2042304 RepID=UPI0025703D42|nr:ABC transporter substrate-binding protein [Gracilibacillus phocaeensis]
MLDLSDQPWVEEAYEGTLEFAEYDEQYLGMPVTVEAFGFIYNEDVVNEAVGGEFDPASINTQDALRGLLEDISALEDTEGTYITSEDWTLGAHWTNLPFTNQSEETEERHQFMEDLKAGEVSLADNEVFNGWLDTFDMAKEFNGAKNSPLSALFDESTIQLSSGSAGLWFMGNWAYPPLNELDPEVNYGIMPVPVSNNPDDFGNSKISVGVPSYWVVDAEQSTDAEQEAAKEFLNWMVSSEEGQDYYVNEFKFLPIYNHMDIEPEDTISKQVLEYMENEETLEWMNLYYPSDAYPTMGESMQKYLADEISREELTEEFQTYWESQE